MGKGIKNLVWLVFSVAAACTPDTQVNRPANHPPSVLAPTPEPTAIPPIAQAPAAVSQPRRALRFHSTTRDGILMHVVAFDDRDHQLRVADQPGGIGARWTTARQAAAAVGGIAAINGGFFTPEGKPLGLLVENGKRRGGLSRSSLGAGIYLSSQTHSAIIRRETYQKTRGSWNPSHLLQTGPMLVDNKKPVAGLSKNNRRPRSFVAWDGKHHWVIGQTGACTLHALANALAGRTPGGFEIRTAVNLDGGSSCDLWVGSSVPDGGKTHRGFFSKAVRNYLVLVKR